jgi:hypothetical protein
VDNPDALPTCGLPDGQAALPLDEVDEVDDDDEEEEEDESDELFDDDSDDFGDDSDEVLAGESDELFASEVLAAASAPDDASVVFPRESVA